MAAMAAMFATSVQIADAESSYQSQANRYGGAEMEEEEEEEEEEDGAGVLGDQPGPEFDLPEITHVPRVDIFIPNVIDLVDGRLFPGDDEYEETEEEELARLLQDSFRDKMQEVFSRNGQTAPSFLQAALDQLFCGATPPYARRHPEQWANWQAILCQLYEQHVLMLKQAQLRHQA